MNVTSNATAVTTQVSGAVTLVSASTSKTAEYVASSAPSPEVIETATKVIISSDFLALGSFVVMLVSAVWNFYSNRRRDKIIKESNDANIKLRERELELKEREIALREKGC